MLTMKLNNLDEYIMCKRETEKKLLNYLTELIASLTQHTLSTTFSSPFRFFVSRENVRLISWVCCAQLSTCTDYVCLICPVLSVCAHDYYTLPVGIEAHIKAVLRKDIDISFRSLITALHMRTHIISNLNDITRLYKRFGSLSIA